MPRVDALLRCCYPCRLKLAGEVLGGGFDWKFVAREESVEVFAEVSPARFVRNIEDARRSMLAALQGNGFGRYL